MSLPDSYRYTKDHEWVSLEGDSARVGITDFAQSELGELVFVDLPVAGRSVEKGATLCVVESTKAASDVYSPIRGTVSSVNEALGSNPTLINSAPYTDGWLAILKDISAADIEGLMTAAQYEALLNSKK